MSLGENGKSAKDAVKFYDYRCSSCGRLWFRGWLPIGTQIRIRCPKCGQFGEIVQQARLKASVTVELEAAM